MQIYCLQVIHDNEIASMLHKPLPNYLRAHRKRCALSQQDLAALLNCHDTTISNYERFERTPDLRTAVALLVVLDAPVDDVFTGLLHEMRDVVATRAIALPGMSTSVPPSDSLSNIRAATLNRLSQGVNPNIHRSS